MIIRAVADTHAILWYLFNHSRLSPTAGKLMDDTVDAGDQIAVSSMTPAEIVFLVERGRVDATSLDRVLAELDTAKPLLIEIPVDRAIITPMRLITRAQVPELPDRIIAATAQHLGVPLMSRDHKIKASSVMTIW